MAPSSESPVRGDIRLGHRVVPQFHSESSLPSSVSEHLDNQKELLEEMYEEKLKILKESLTSFYQEEIQVSLPHPVPTVMQTSVTWLSEMNKILLIFNYLLVD